MKFVSAITFVFTLVAIGLLLKVYVDKKKSLDDYPYHRTITSADGRQLDVVIHGKSEEGLVIERLVDGQIFNLPLERLAPEDRSFASNLRVNRKSPETEQAGSVQTTSNREDTYVQNRLDEIKQLKAKRVELKTEIESGKLNSSLISAREGEIEQIIEEIESLSSAIKEFESR